MKHRYITQEIKDVGNSVICDVCSKDWTSSPVSGGFLFGSYAYCPECAKTRLAGIKQYREESHIRAWCPKNLSFSAWVLKLRAGDNRIIYTTYKTKEER